MVAIVGAQNGDPRRLIYGSDHNGTTCGGDLKLNQKFIHYPRSAEDVFYAGESAALGEYL